MIRALIVLALPMAASCYLMTEGGDLPAGRLEVEQFGGRGGTYGRDLLDVHLDGSFEVLSLYDARVCRGVLERGEQQGWRDIVRALREPWVRPPSEVVIDGSRRCASLEPGGRSTGCERDGGTRERAANFAYELRARFEDDDDECEALSGEPVLFTSWSVIPVEGADLGIQEFINVEWRGGRARSKLLEEYDEWSECPAPTSEQRDQLDALAYVARDAMRLPRPYSWTFRGDPPSAGWFELSQLFFVSVFVESPYGQRGNRLVGVDPDLYRNIGLALAEVCELATDDPRR